LKEVGKIRYPTLSPEDQWARIVKLVTSEEAGPVARATQSLKTDVTDRLTDTSKYTGTHKERFNADGTGRGLDGRDSKPSISLSNIADRSPADVRGVNNSFKSPAPKTVASYGGEKRGRVDTESTEAMNAANSAPLKKSQVMSIACLPLFTISSLIAAKILVFTRTYVQTLTASIIWT
jgi:hypothetical protein